MPDIKYIFVTGGVTSSLGKGIIAASLGQATSGAEFQGYHPEVRSLTSTSIPERSIPTNMGSAMSRTMGPKRIWTWGITRGFLNIKTSQANNVTTGRVYQSVIEKERRGESF